MATALTLPFWDHEAMSEARIPADEPAHDVLAAEEFAMPAPDPSLHHGPVRLPDDPTGIAEPHDVLAAEEFAMPAAHPSTGVMRHRDGRRAAVPLVLCGFLVVVALLRLLRRR
jgi:hypothetical protein